ncbi:hypothetical protein FAM22020_001285 [Propionibacterium freudenreichii]|uniref:hypothetical protein n=1 Tax=Propionibacterium freudenreichii TaxID=1744 RepID=UPI0005422B0F|nr:hypothetical protein [Propionibacterium freudenreichii]MCT2999333.1 hypothetical protein [Propionibacterium freudenreichii]MCT3014751.1 hypothetical protein [Propionibacterium freudenreichii]MCT3018538.1 hypothetical protein [Propionibacterium freudenreichii]MDK9353614.1 hypothetical protein [Propionibacterium freudenreichii]MDK9610732.1 hypothetical protein [Propionibacterium freudenreichii]
MSDTTPATDQPRTAATPPDTEVQPTPTPAEPEQTTELTQAAGQETGEPDRPTVKEAFPDGPDDIVRETIKYRKRAQAAEARATELEAELQTYRADELERLAGGVFMLDQQGGNKVSNPLTGEFIKFGYQLKHPEDLFTVGGVDREAAMTGAVSVEQITEAAARLHEARPELFQPIDEDGRPTSRIKNTRQVEDQWRLQNKGKSFPVGMGSCTPTPPTNGLWKDVVNGSAYRRQ